MPKDAAHIRGDQLKTLAGLIHKEKVSKKFANALSQLIDLPSGKVHMEGLNDSQEAALREWRRDYMIEKGAPLKFVEKFTYLTSQAMLVWREARKEKKFEKIRPLPQEDHRRLQEKGRTHRLQRSSLRCPVGSLRAWHDHASRLRSV